MSDTGGEARDERDGLIKMILTGMHPGVKALMFSLLAVPLVLALSGMLLQVNVGAVIQKYLDQVDVRNAQQTAQIGDIVSSSIAELGGSVAAILRQVSEGQQRLDALEDRAGATEEHLKRLDDEIARLKAWTCSHDGEQARPCQIRP